MQTVLADQGFPAEEAREMIGDDGAAEKRESSLWRSLTVADFDVQSPVLGHEVAVDFAGAFPEGGGERPSLAREVRERSWRGKKKRQEAPSYMHWSKRN